MAPPPVFGTCHLCGRVKRLTFEHLPARVAGNRDPTPIFGFDHWMARKEGLPILGVGMPRGHGKFTLCGECTSKTGNWYGAEYGVFVEQARNLLTQWLTAREADYRLEPEIRRVVFERVMPLRFIKQVAAYALSLCDEGFAMASEDLRRFILDRSATGLPDAYRVYITLYRGPLIRFHGLDGRLDFVRGRADLACELAWPPLAYVLTVDSKPGFQPCGDVTHWGEIPFDRRMNVEADLEVGFGHLPEFIADYRSGLAIARDTLANVRDGMEPRPM
jgi:hypothetical protein